MDAVKTYTADEMNRAISLVEIAKQNHPRGWRYLRDFRLPEDSLVAYAYANADAHVKRLAGEDRRLIYSVGWLQGLAIGVALAQSGDAGSSGSMPVPEQCSQLPSETEPPNPPH